MLLFLLFAGTLPAAWQEPLLPPIDFHPDLVDGTGKWYIHAQTVPGYHYQRLQGGRCLIARTNSSSA